jgi:hypothetical protein
MNRISIHIESEGLTSYQAEALATLAASFSGVFMPNVNSPVELDEPTPQEKAAVTKKANAAKAKADKEAAEAAAALEVNEPEDVDPMTEETDDDIMGTDTPAVTLVEIRSLTQGKVKANKPALVDLLTKLGATGISDLDPKHYATFYAFLQKLK